MKAEKNQSKTKAGSVGTVVSAFVTGAAAGFAVGALLNANKKSSFKDKLKNLISDFSRSSVDSGYTGNTRKENTEEEIRPAGYVQDTDDKPDPEDNKNDYNS